VKFPATVDLDVRLVCISNVENRRDRKQIEVLPTRSEQIGMIEVLRAQCPHSGGKDERGIHFAGLRVG